MVGPPGWSASRRSVEGIGEVWSVVEESKRRELRGRVRPFAGASRPGSGCRSEVSETLSGRVADAAGTGADLETRLAKPTWLPGAVCADGRGSTACFDRLRSACSRRASLAVVDRGWLAGLADRLGLLRVRAARLAEDFAGLCDPEASDRSRALVELPVGSFRDRPPGSNRSWLSPISLVVVLRSLMIQVSPSGVTTTPVQVNDPLNT